MTANLAFAPLRGTNDLYDTLGVDFFHDADLETGESQGDAQQVEWVEHDAAAEFDETAADQIILDKGFRRVGPWDYSLDDYAQARIERL